MDDPNYDVLEVYRRDIERFVDAMRFKMRKNTHKGRWEGKSVEDMWPLLLGEVDELKRAISSQNTVEILLEAADVANMAMIISSIAVERGINDKQEFTHTMNTPENSYACSHGKFWDETCDKCGRIRIK